MLPQVAARTEMGVRRRAQAMSRSCSKRKSRFSSLWGLDTTSKKKTKAHPSINQVWMLLPLPKWPTKPLGCKDLFFFSLSQALTVYNFFGHWAFSLCVPPGLCWWRRASEKAFKWHICWSCQGTHSKYDYFAVGINLIQTRGSQEWVGSAWTPVTCKPSCSLRCGKAETWRWLQLHTRARWSVFLSSLVPFAVICRYYTAGVLTRQGGVPFAVWLKLTCAISLHLKINK